MRIDVAIDQGDQLVDQLVEYVMDDGLLGRGGGLSVEGAPVRVLRGRLSDAAENV